MEVTKATWSEAVVAEWQEAVNECDFIAMDTELTGLADGYRSNRSDSAATRFAKNRKAAAEFALTQLGLCAFRKDTVSGTWTAKPLSVYVLPQKKAFMVEGSAVTFLQNHRFDFNKWSKGVDYLPHSEEAAMRVKGRLQALGNALQSPDVATVRRGHDVQLLYKRAYVPLVQAIAAAEEAAQQVAQSDQDKIFKLAAEVAEGERAAAWTVLHSTATSVQVPGHDWVAEAEAAASKQDPQHHIDTASHVQVPLPPMRCVRLGCALDSFPRKMLRDILHCGSWAKWVQASGAEAAWTDLQQREAVKRAEAVAEQAAAAGDDSSPAAAGGQEAEPAAEAEGASQELMQVMPDLGVQLHNWAVDYDEEDQHLPNHGVNRWRKVVRMYDLAHAEADLPQLPQWLLQHMPAECTPLQQRWKWWIVAKNAAAAAAKLSASVGARQLWDIVAASGKPVAGHNCLLDLLHLSDAFLGSVSAHPHAWASQQVLQQLAPGGVLDSKHLLLWMREQIAGQAGGQQMPLDAVQLKQALESSVGRGPTGLGTAYAALETLRVQPAGAQADTAEAPLFNAAGDTAMRAAVPVFQTQPFKALQVPAAAAAATAGDAEDAAKPEAAAKPAEDFAHDAAYDAYMTGCIVAHVQELMGALFAASGGSLPQGAVSAQERCLGALTAAHNTLHVMWSRHASEWCLQADTSWYLEDAQHWRQARVRTLHVDRLNHTIGTRHLVDMANAALHNAGATEDVKVTKDDVIWIDDRSGVVQLPSAGSLAAVLKWAHGQVQLHGGNASRWRLASLPCISAFGLSSWAEHVGRNAELYGPLALEEATEEASLSGNAAASPSSMDALPRSKKPRL